MERKRIHPDLEKIPAAFHALLANAAIYDSSCSPEARVFFIDKDGGYFLKSSPKGALKKEEELTRFFYKKQLAADVLAYVCEDEDWLLTQRIPGEDCTHAVYLENPGKLCETTAELLRKLHDTSVDDCPVPNRTESYLETAEYNYRAGIFDSSLFLEDWSFSSAQEAWKAVQNDACQLKSDTLLHGDYCLPNIILRDWCFSGFVDLGCGGIGDRHVDLFWGIWTLYHNLKTNKYRERFIDAYGRSDVNMETLRVIAAIEAFG